MPSFTFVSTANAFVLRGATPVFVDIRPDTLNIDETQIEAAITPRTKAIVPVHYAGVGCEMDAIMDDRRARTACSSSRTRRRASISTYRGRPLGSIGAPGGALSFHETKNIICGEGGALLRQRPTLRRARRDHPGEGHQPQPVLPRPGRQVHLGRHRLVVPAQRDRRGVPLGADGGGRRRSPSGGWRSGTRTTMRFAELEADGTRPPPDRPGRLRAQRAHVLPAAADLARGRSSSSGSTRKGVHSVFHYVPLHSSPFGTIDGTFGRRHDEYRLVQRATGPPAALARPRGAARFGHRRGHRRRREPA